jgi:hypothetical protein
MGHGRRPRTVHHFGQQSVTVTEPGPYGEEAHGLPRRINLIKSERPACRVAPRQRRRAVRTAGRGADGRDRTRSGHRGVRRADTGSLSPFVRSVRSGRTQCRGAAVDSSTGQLPE